MTQPDRERQWGKCLADIRYDHVDRYAWAARNIPEGSRVADLGCGVGYGSKILADSGCLVIGIDKSEGALAHAKKYFRSKAMFRQGDFDGAAEIRAVPAHIYDNVVAFEIIEHLKHPVHFLSSYAKATKEHGFFSVPNQEAIPWDKEKFPEHIRHYTLDEFDSLLTSCGWEILSWHCQLGKYGPVCPTNGWVDTDRINAIRILKPRTLIVIAKSLEFKGEEI